jgi:phage baseplate assembly protein W
MKLGHTILEERQSVLAQTDYGSSLLSFLSAAVSHATLQSVRKPNLYSRNT